MISLPRRTSIRITPRAALLGLVFLGFLEGCDDSPTALVSRSLFLARDTATIAVDDSVRLTANLIEQGGDTVFGVAVTWSSLDEAVVSVDSDGQAIGLAAGEARIVAARDAASDTAVVTVTPVFVSLSIGGWHTCGVTNSGDLYCWGLGESGQLGSGAMVNADQPQLAAGELLFQSVSAGFVHTCGITRTEDAYCWGVNTHRQLGTGIATPVECLGDTCSEPVLVLGFLSFAQLSAGLDHTCGLTTDGAAFCWGRGQFGALGDGTRASHSEPHPVTGGLTFESVSASGLRHTCGLAASGGVYCWGAIASDNAPAAVPGGLSFESITVGAVHACGLTSDGRAYCWGSNSLGQLGDGLTEDQAEPVQVTSGLRFRALSSGWYHTCGISESGGAYCWGRNLFGEVGKPPTEMCGATQCSTSPISVSGGLSFAFVDGGGAHTCGLTERGDAYCWGYNGFGQLGDGSTTNTIRPVRVSKPRAP